MGLRDSRAFSHARRATSAASKRAMSDPDDSAQPELSSVSAVTFRAKWLERWNPNKPSELAMAETSALVVTLPDGGLRYFSVKKTIWPAARRRVQQN